jgi:hypothetical protein
MILSSKWMVLAAVLAIASAASQAWAAGVAQLQGPQLTQGWVIGVHRVNGQLAFRVQTARVNNQAVLAANCRPCKTPRRFLSAPALNSKPHKA